MRDEPERQSRERVMGRPRPWRVRLAPRPMNVPGRIPGSALITVRRRIGLAGGARSDPSRYLLIGAAIIALVAVGVGFIAFLHPAVPRVIVMATGAEGGAYAQFGEQYQKFFAREGLHLTVLRTAGSVENIAMLNDRDHGASIGFVQSGTTNPQRSPDLVSLGTVAVEPLWIFGRATQTPRDGLAELRGMHVAIGPAKSGMQRLARELLAQNGINGGNTELLPLNAAQASAQLFAGDIDAAMIVASADAPAVQQLLGSPEIELVSLKRADAFVARYPYLSKVVVPEGFADFEDDRPRRDVEMVAVKTNLVVRRDLASPVQYLLLEAASQIHSHPEIFQKAGEFPAAEATDLPLSEDAEQFYRSGPPLLQRNLPLWLAILIKQLAITLLPILAIAYPLLRALPAAYAWRMRRRIFALYGELKLLELALEAHDQEQGAAELSDLSRLEYRAAHLRVPTSYAHLLYTLQQDIGHVRTKLDRSLLTDS
jgi:TRAP transporter TAXI family solute receptor